MKKALFFAAFLFLTVFLPSCSAPLEQLRPDEARIQSICNLATLECYYHNVAKSVVNGAFDLEATQKKIWIEYTGTVKIGVDFSKVRCKIQDDVVTVTIPKAQVLDVGIDNESYTGDSFYVENGLFTGKIKAEEQTEAIRAAQELMKQNVSADEALLFSAQSRAKEMIESYIIKLGKIAGKTYRIEWTDAE